MAYPVLRRLFRTAFADEITPEWLANFSAESYLVMEGLLGGEDFRFLSRQPGFDLSLQRKLRRERIDILQMYLNRMIGDFNRLHLVARLLVAQSKQDQSAVLLQLVWLRVRFSLSAVRMSYSLWLCRFGLSTLPVRSIVAQLGAMSEQMIALSPVQQSA